MTPSRLTVSQLLNRFVPGAVIYIPGASGELRWLQQALAAEPERLRGVTLVSCLIPGINDFDYAALHPQARLRTFMMSPALRASFDAGRAEVLPLSYVDIAAYLAALRPDLAILHLTPARAGRCSFGVCADFGPLAASGARSRIGLLNAAMPRPSLGPELALEALDGVVELDEPIHAPPAGDSVPSSDLVAIGEHVAALVPDGATVQTGIGAAPAAVWTALRQRRGLRLASGIVTDGFLAAVDAGAMAAHGHLAGFAFGGVALYRRLAESDLVRFADTTITHGAAPAASAGFTAINSAIEIDLFGQANLEWQQGRLVSGVGGAPDFARAARRSPGGRSIIALPATARRGTVSRISLRLDAPAVSLARSEIDAVVTEHGTADLRGLDIDARARVLIAIAAPAFREALEDGWRRQRAGF